VGDTFSPEVFASQRGAILHQVRNRYNNKQLCPTHSVPKISIEDFLDEGLSLEQTNNNLAVIKEGLGDKKAGIADLTKAIQLDPIYAR
jgi:hypothetical protein